MTTGLYERFRILVINFFQTRQKAFITFILNECYHILLNIPMPYYCKYGLLCQKSSRYAVITAAIIKKYGD